MGNAVAHPSQALPGQAEQVWTIKFKPASDLFACGGNPATLFRELATMGACEIQAHVDEIPALDEIQFDSCYLSWTIVLRSACDRDAIRDVFIFVEDGSSIEINSASEPLPAAESNAKLQQVEVISQPGSRKTQTKESSVRVPAAKLDRLVALVGELVTNQARLAQVASRFDSPELAFPVEEIERLVAELRDDVLGIRMMQIGTIFGRFRRLVHDLSTELGKEVDLVTAGEETELDKSILDQLAEPLVHLLRNSIDHGIEPADQRTSQGKPRRGTISLRAEHTGSGVVVTIEDDGRGLNREAIRARAVERGLIAADANLTDKDLLNLILLPGFSTAATITNVSGRGVGMDVVKKQIDALRGSLVLASEPGKGTRITLTLPLTLAIIEGLLVEIGPHQFIVPMTAVMENVELHRADRLRGNGRNVIPVRGTLIPYIDLRESFSLGGDIAATEKIVIVQHENQRVGLLVERVLGTHQTVIQSLGRFFRRIEVVSGSTVMGDGRVALILDIPAIIRLVDHGTHDSSLGRLNAA
jgi:two-component system chemotaxis sensor kinase CheA